MWHVNALNRWSLFNKDLSQLWIRTMWTACHTSENLPSTYIQMYKIIRKSKGWQVEVAYDLVKYAIWFHSCRLRGFFEILLLWKGGCVILTVEDREFRRTSRDECIFVFGITGARSKMKVCHRIWYVNHFRYITSMLQNDRQIGVMPVEDFPTTL